MKLLLVVADIEEIKPCLSHFKAEVQQDYLYKFLSSCRILHHEVAIVSTGAGLYQTTYKVTKALAREKYHLALKLGLGNAYKAETQLGTALNVINEKPGDTGSTIEGEWKDLYDLGLVKVTDEPHIKGGLINWTNAYMNVFLPFKKVVGLTVNNYANKQQFSLRREKYKADCETGDGLGFAYPCLYEKQLFYQLVIIERNLATGTENVQLALETLNNTLIEILTKL